MKRRICGLAFLLTVCVVPLAADKRIYIAPDDHTDYLWSADEEDYRKAFVEMIDYYLDLADATSDAPSQHQSRWNCDGSFWLRTYENNKTGTQFQRLVRRIQDGHISVPLNALVSCYGAQPAEAVLRGMYYAGYAERRYGLDLPIAIAMENQTLPYGLGALWAGAGARYSWKGICGCATKMRRNERRPHEVYWWKGADGSRILMKWYTLLERNRSVGGYAEAWDPAAAVDLVSNDPRFAAIHPYPVVGLFGKGWDDFKTLTDEFVRVAKEKTHDTRQVIVSNQLDYFRDIEKSQGTELPELSAAFGNEWDLYSASLSEVSASVRRAVERLRAAEALAAIVRIHRPDLLDGRSDARDRAWMNLGLYWEHNWTADGKTISRAAREAWQRRLAMEIESYVNGLYRDAAYALGGLIKRTGDASRFYVFNPLSWTRSDIADLPIEMAPPVHAVDLTSGREIPSQVVRLSDRTYKQGRRRLRVWVDDVPSLGYKVIEVRPGAGRDDSAAISAEDNHIENDFHRVQVSASGAIVSWIDKRRGDREMVRAIAGRTVNDIGPGEGTVSIENAGPVSATIRAEVGGPLGRTTRITLYRNSPRIDIRNEITENFGDVRDWAFSFALDHPDVWHEEVGAVLHARRISDGGHYSDTNARLDWLTLNHFADMAGRNGAGVTLSNADCAFMRLGNSATQDGVSALDVETPQISVLAGGQVDGPRLGIQNQGGDRYFLQRFALQTRDRFDPATAMRFALEHQNPLVTGRVRGGSAYPETLFSFLSVDNRNVLVWALKPAEDGIDQGLTLRLWNLAREDQKVSARLAGGLSSAIKTTHIENDIGPALVQDSRLITTIGASQLLTFRLKAALGQDGMLQAKPATTGP